MSKSRECPKCTGRMIEKPLEIGTSESGVPYWGIIRANPVAYMCDNCGYIEFYDKERMAQPKAKRKKTYAMKEVYVDASPQSGFVAVFSKGTRSVWLFEPISRDMFTHEAEYFAIIVALRNIKGNFKLFSDSSNVEILNKALSGNIIAPEKHYPYVETIKELCKDRKVEFVQISGEQNKADLSKHTKILLEEEGVKP